MKLTEDIETAFKNRNKCGAVFVDLSAAYDTVWHRGLTLKMLQLIPNKRMVRCICELITNRSFKLYVGKDSSKTYTIKNGVPQGSVLAPILFNIYMYDIPKTAPTNYIYYADDIALMESGLNYVEIQQKLTDDLTNLHMYLQRWRLRLNVEKSVSSCSPVWCRCVHTHRLDSALNNSLRVVSGCIRSTPTFMLPVVSGTMPPDMCRNKQCLALSCRAEAYDQHTLHGTMTTTAPG